MEYFELLQRLAVALGIGLLVGIERGWDARNEPEGERALGLRTLALSGLLGGVIGGIAVKLPAAGAPLLAGAFVAYAFIAAFFRYREMLRDRTLGATTVIAAVLVFALGAFAVAVDPALAAAVGVTAAALLALKATLHAWLRQLTWNELRAGLMLLAMTVIMLPVLPDRPLGPFGAFNPYELWLMTTLIAVVSSVGYVAIKRAGDHWGILLSGVAGGLVSSTAVTLTFSRLARENSAREGLLTAGILIAAATMMLRVLVLAGLFKTAVLQALLPAAIPAGAVFAGWALVLYRRHGDASGAQALTLTSPFETATVLKFGALLAFVMFASKALTALLGTAGAFVVAAASGLADVDAITLTMTQLEGNELTLRAAAGAILVAVLSNSLTKTALAWVTGGRSVGLGILWPTLCALAAGLLGLLLASLAGSALAI